ncbi:MAG: hemolysin family protein [Firmicutes bacterium]|nr:hemolysin family protein [Bacillota bacterium]
MIFSDIIIIFLMLLCAAFFNGSEMAFTSVGEQRLRLRCEEKNTLPRRAALYFVSHFQSLLTTTLIGNDTTTMIATNIATLLVVGLLGEGMSWVATLVMTLLILTFTEIVPKVICKQKAAEFCTISAVPLRVLTVILSPFIFVITLIIKLLSFIWRRKSTDDDVLTTDELESVIDIAEDEGVLDEDESDLVRRAIDYKNIKAYEIITPRVDMEYIDIEDDYEDIKESMMKFTHSRIPVCEGNPDNVIGLVHLNRLLSAEASGRIPDIASLSTPPVFVAKTATIPDIVRRMRETKRRLVFVADDYGGVLGIVTMEDALEILVGDIWDETDDALPDLIELGDGEYDLGGQIWLRELFEELELDGEEYEEIADEFTVLCGWCADRLGLAPEIGDGFTFGRLSFTVSGLDGIMVDRMRLTVLPDEDEDDEGDDSDEEHLSETE